MSRGESSGRMVGPYAIVRALGQGAAGDVYLARGPDGAEVALKQLRSLSPQGCQRFEREARLLRELSGEEGFVPLLDLGSAGGVPYLVMPFLPGGNLQARLLGGGLPLEQVRRIGATLAAALGRAHARGIVHRDVKPENVLFRPDGAPLLADLGLAKHLDGERLAATQALSQSGDWRGTVGYAPLEQLRDAKAAGPAADVFALAALLYECLTGRPAWSGASPLEVLQAVQEGRLEPVRALRPETPPGVADLLARSLRPEPAERPADGAAFAAEWARCWASPRAPRREPLPLAAGAALTVGVALAVAIALGPGPDPAPDPVAPAATPSAAGHGPPAPAQDDAERTALLARAHELLARRDGPGSWEVCQRLPERLPDAAEAWACRSRARCLLARDLEEALDDATHALALDPDLGWGLGARGWVRLLQGDAGGALPDLDRAVERLEDDALLRALRGMARVTLGRYHLALSDGERAVALDPNLALGWECRGDSLLGLGDPEGAIADLDRALALEPRRAKPLGMRGLARFRQGRPREALGDMDEALRIEPDDAVLLGNRGLVKKRLDDLPGALADMDRALELDPRLAGVYENRASVRIGLGDHAGGIVDCDRALALEPRSTVALMNRASARLAVGQNQGALDDVEAALRLAPNASWAELARKIRDQARARLDAH